MKKMYEIAVHGCDDSTTIKQELTFEEYELLKEIAEKITNTSSYGCMPTMGIRAVKNDRIELWVDGENVATATDIKINKAKFSSPSGNVWDGFIVEQGD